MPAFDPFLTRSFGPSGEPVVRLGVQLLDDYLDFVAARCRPNTVLATAYDLLVFFRVVGKSGRSVRTIGWSYTAKPDHHRDHPRRRRSALWRERMGGKQQ